MRRRDVLGLLGGTVLLVRTPGAKAKRAKRVRHIGWLTSGARFSPAAWQVAMAQLRERGWIEGENLIIEPRAAGDNAERLQPYADELVRLNVELIVTTDANATIAARNATTRIPIVMIMGADPVRLGVVASLSRPGGNITGYTSNLLDVEAKRLALLREVLPGAERVAVFVNPANAYWRAVRSEREQLYRSFRLTPVFVAVAAASEIDRAVTEAHHERVHALMIPRDEFWWRNRDALMHAAMRQALPTFVAGSDMTSSGALLSFAPDDTDPDRALAYCVDRILRGTKPADIPVQQTTRYELSINLRTAKTLGITVPQSLLLRADEVIR